MWHCQPNSSNLLLCLQFLPLPPTPTKFACRVHMRGSVPTCCCGSSAQTQPCRSLQCSSACVKYVLLHPKPSLHCSGPAAFTTSGRYLELHSTSMSGNMPTSPHGRRAPDANWHSTQANMPRHQLRGESRSCYRRAAHTALTQLNATLTISSVWELKKMRREKCPRSLNPAT